MTDTDIRHILVEHGHEWMAFARALLRAEREAIARMVEPINPPLATLIKERK